MIFIIQLFIFLLGAVLYASYVSLLERKLIARIQLRVGPDNCGIGGAFQPIADALKLFFKRNPFKNHSMQEIFGVSLLFTTALIQLTLIPNGMLSLKYSLLWIILCRCFLAFSETLIGVSSKSKYGIIGGSRAYLQTVGSHIPFLLSIATVMSATKSLELTPIPYGLKILPLAIVFFITMLMSGSRTPFDFIEAESELIAGAYVEYGGILFAMIYLSDYLNLLFISALTATLFLGGGCLVILALKAFAIICFVILIRSILPRYTQDQMIEISWTILSPLLLLYIILNLAR
ncbi:MAG: NADH-quinone oxidoreductase subunit H [Holosporales bacterium]|jgi:NADH-quinone oxidoreductase subunit H|nr:NADH-quinone oxidoreductase subunit H [Holosporales bacterium]